MRYSGLWCGHSCAGSLLLSPLPSSRRGAVDGLRRTAFMMMSGGVSWYASGSQTPASTTSYVIISAILSPSVIEQSRVFAPSLAKVYRNLIWQSPLCHYLFSLVQCVPPCCHQRSWSHSACTSIRGDADCMAPRLVVRGVPATRAAEP